MLIAEDLLLLLTDDRTGRLLVSSKLVDIALGGAILIELGLAQRVDLAGEAGPVRQGRLVVVDASSTSDDLLDQALADLAQHQGARPKDVVAGLGKGLRARLHTRLAEQGFLREKSGKMLGIFPTHRWPSSDTTHELAVRARLTDALRTGATADAHAAALVSLLHALNAVGKVIDPAAVGVTKKELHANANHIAEGDWGSQAVRQAIDSIQTALIAATSSSTVAVSGGT